MVEPTAAEPLVVCGAGLAGSLLSLYLARRGYFVDIYERRQDSRGGEFVGGRSINLALSTRGLNALRGVGLEDEIRKHCIPMHGRLVHDLDGAVNMQPYGREGQYINSVSRQLLNEVLLQAADDHSHVNFHFEKACVDVDLEDGSPTFEDTKTGQTEKVPTRYLFAADGAYSSVRQVLQKSGRFDFSQNYLPHGYKELEIPALPDGGWRIEKNVLHIWPRHDFMMIALPNTDGSFTVTLFMAFDGGPNSFAALETEQDVVAFFEREFPDAIPLMPNLVEDFFSNPTGPLVTIRCEPYHSGDQVLLLGDSAHAIVPFYGQGMNAAFEDCFIIDQIIDRYAPDWGTVGRVFSATRKDDADAIADLAIYNFLEMRSKVADPKFLVKKKVDRALHEAFPEQWMPLYSMVTFSNMPYSEARERAARQDRMLKYGAWGLAGAGALGLLAALRR